MKKKAIQREKVNMVPAELEAAKFMS